VGVIVKVGSAVAVEVAVGRSVAVGVGVSVRGGSVGEGATVGAWAVGLAQAPAARIMMRANVNKFFLYIVTPERCTQFYHQPVNQAGTNWTLWV